jgi:biotin operon repressor
MKPAITPGEILLEDYLIPMGISQNALARALGISPRSINESHQELHRSGRVILNHRSHWQNSAPPFEKTIPSLTKKNLRFFACNPFADP